MPVQKSLASVAFAPLLVELLSCLVELSELLPQAVKLRVQTLKFLPALPSDHVLTSVLGLLLVVGQLPVALLDASARVEEDPNTEPEGNQQTEETEEVTAVERQT